MFYRAYIQEIYNRSHYNTTDIQNMAKILIACGLQENFLSEDGFFGEYYEEFNSIEDVQSCINERKDALIAESVTPQKLISEIEELLNCKNASDLNTKFSESQLYFSGIGFEEADSPFADYDSLDEYERDDYWECFPVEM